MKMTTNKMRKSTKRVPPSSESVVDLVQAVCVQCWGKRPDGQTLLKSKLPLLILHQYTQPPWLFKSVQCSMLIFNSLPSSKFWQNIPLLGYHYTLLFGWHFVWVVSPFLQQCIHLAILTNSSYNLENYLGQFRQIHLVCTVNKASLLNGVLKPPRRYGVLFIAYGRLSKKRFSCRRELMLQLVWPGVCPYQAKCSEFSLSPKSIQEDTHWNIASMHAYFSKILFFNNITLQLLWPRAGP